ncbi:helix-turn-helix transcriptional regulator [Streptomyces microflavus]|nr:helix-turn-helix transcriptional regulator [Streptomyces microflavus]QQZ54982.1 helix-turn-helix transcriptional regulator [Streptomyces microflavus]
MCDPALRLYEKALHAGRIARTDLTDAPCLLELALLHPDPSTRPPPRPGTRSSRAQPGSDRPAGKLQEALANAHTAIRRGARIRHIYQHPARYSGSIRDYLSQVPAQHLRVRTTELTVERLIIIDRSVAHIPASADRSTALRISHPALVSYLIQVYEVLWAQAVPLAENHQATAPNAPVTAVQHSIARLLAEGHVDDVVARKMGISVRTCRSHIARLMQTLGATSRTHPGTLLARSGITSTSTSPHEPPA